jgi:hypothetical protein
MSKLAAYLAVCNLSDSHFVAAARTAETRYNDCFRSPRHSELRADELYAEWMQATRALHFARAWRSQVLDDARDAYLSSDEASEDAPSCVLPA